MPELKPEQKEAINFDQGNIMISASAGSGKTFVMVERAIRLIAEKKAKVKEILAVTFTEAAAEGMKERIKKALINKINDGCEDLSGELTDLYGSDICTLHSFCGRLIRTHFFVAGVSPDYQVADESQSQPLKEQSLDETFKSYYDIKDASFIRLADRYKEKRSDKKLRKLILKIFEYTESELDRDAFYGKSLYNVSDEGYKKVKDELTEILVKRAEDGIKEAEFLISKLVPLKIGGEEMLNCLLADFIRIKENGLYALCIDKNYKYSYSFKRNVDSETKGYTKRAVALRDGLCDLKKEWSEFLTDEDADLNKAKGLSEHTSALISAVKKFSEIYQRKKTEENLLDFNDLERYALKVLKDETSLNELRKKYKYIFVDEYQDINAIQEEIIKRISNDNLFMVGDAKQSIYGFRGCRPKIFEEKFGNMQASGQKTVKLNDNFRSSDEVIKRVNEIFDYCMVKDYYGVNYKDMSRLVSGGGYTDDAKGRVEFHFLHNKPDRSKKTEEPRVYDIKEEYNKNEEKDGLKVSALIAKIIETELGNNYYDLKEKTFKRIEYKDITVLTRNRDNAYVAEVTEGLIKRGVPINSEASQNVCSFPEIATLIYALRLVDCFSLDAPLVATLKSPIGGFTEEQLAEIVLNYTDGNPDAHGGFSDAFAYCTEHAESLELKDKVNAFSGYFADIRYLSDYLGARGVLEKLIDDCGYENCLLASSAGDIKLKRLRRFLSLTEKNGKSCSVSEFLSRIDAGGKEFNVTECGSDNAVKIMTIHSSKGLEFPVTIVCGLERKRFRKDEDFEVLFDRDLGIATKFFDDKKRTYSETLLRGLIREKMRITGVKEEMRLLYVATTRAEYSLHLICEGDKDERKEVFRGAERFTDYIPSSIPATFWEGSDFDKVEKIIETKSVLIGKADDSLIEKIKKTVAFRYGFTEETALPLKKTVTSANAENKAESVSDTVVSLTDDTDNEKGTVAHKILQYTDFSDLQSFYGQVEEMVNRGVLTKEEKESVNLDRLNLAVNSGIFNGVESKTLYREKGFIVNIEANKVVDTVSTENILLQGTIDLLMIKDGVAEIVDYKYSRHTGKGLKERYKKQLDLYAYAVEKILGLKVKSKTLLNIYSGESVTVD